MIAAPSQTHVPKSRSAARLWKHIRAEEFDFWQRAKTRTVMLWSGISSLLWGFSTYFERDSTFNGPSYIVMRATGIPAGGWLTIFAAYTVFVFVCRWWIGGPPRKLLIATCFYGFLIWGFYVIATDVSLGLWYAPGTSSELVMVFMLGWSLRRAGRKPVDYADHG